MWFHSAKRFAVVDLLEIISCLKCVIYNRLKHKFLKPSLIFYLLYLDGLKPLKYTHSFHAILIL